MLKLIFIGLTIASCHGFLWYPSSSESSTEAPAQPTPSRQQTYPITYIRAFAYHPVAFPQPLAPITTYHVRNQQINPMLPSKSGFQTPRGVPGFPTVSKSDSPSSYGISTHQQLPQSLPTDFGTPPTTTTTSTTTTTPAPTTTTQQPFVPSQPAPMMSPVRSGDGYQRQMFYGGNNFGGFPQFYNQPYNPYPYLDQNVGNPFTGRVYGNAQPEPQYQQYTTDSVTYQFVPTSITPIQQPQNSVKFVPCMCPVAVSVSAPIPEKRTDDIPLPLPQQNIDETQTQTLTSSNSKVLDEIDIEESK